MFASELGVSDASNDLRGLNAAEQGKIEAGTGERLWKSRSAVKSKNGLSHLAWKSANPADFHFPHSLGCYGHVNCSLSNEYDSKTNDSTLPEVNLLPQKLGLDIGVHFTDQRPNTRNFSVDKLCKFEEVGDSQGRGF
jgi:hypothetical protein